MTDSPWLAAYMAAAVMVAMSAWSMLLLKRVKDGKRIESHIVYFSLSLFAASVLGVLWPAWFMYTMVVVIRQESNDVV